MVSTSPASGIVNELMPAQMALVGTKKQITNQTATRQK